MELSNTSCYTLLYRKGVLAPDGSYSESYNPSLWGKFFGQGGYQTCHRVTAGSERDRGRWDIAGTLEGVKNLLPDSMAVKSS